MAVLSTLILTTQLVSAVLCPFALTTAHQCVMCETAIVCSFIAVMITGRVVLVLGDCDHHKIYDWKHLSCTGYFWLSTWLAILISKKHVDCVITHN